MKNGMKWSIFGIIIVAFLVSINSAYALSFDDIFSWISGAFGRITGYATTDILSSCPYECCPMDDPTYQVKACEYPKTCAGYKCVDVETTTITPETTTTPIVVKEGINCIFVGSDSERKCFTDDWKFSCAGMGSCTAYISGENGAKLLWKSSCSGEAYTILDGYDDTVEFKCEITATEQPQTETTTTPSTCTDSDGGKNYDVKGTTKDRWGEHTDYCSNERQITEFYCYDSGDGRGSVVWNIGAVDCRYGCKDGACLPQPTPVCGNGICEDNTEKASCPQDCKIACYQDSDCGQITTKKICDYPTSPGGIPNIPYACRVESNYRCENSGTYDSRCMSGEGRSCIPCQSGCQDGECIGGETQTTTCTDSDGINYYLKGYIESNGMKDFDNCRVINSNTEYSDTSDCSGENCYVLESSCTSSGTAYAYVWKCPDACNDGACIKGEEVKEQVKCMFTNTDSMQKCYADDGRFGCVGIGSCIAVVYGNQGTKLTWKSSCDGYAYTVIDGNNDYAEFKCGQSPTQPIPIPGIPIEEVKEQVKCLFVNSVSTQKCTAGKPGFECEGIGSCVVNVNGPHGEKLVWKSTCGGYAYTMMDGINEPAEFKCESTPTPTPTREQVQCVFLDSRVLQYPHSTTEECYTDDQRFGCKWDGNVVEEYIDGKPFRYAHCMVEVPGNYGEKLIWKSSCGGYAYTVIDGNNEKAEFKCIPETNVTMDQIVGKGFKKAYWQCYDGTEQHSVTGVTMQCWTAEYWQEHAKNACLDNCRKFENLDITKCGVNSFSVFEECYIGEEGTVFIPPEKVGKEPSETPTEEMLICKDSCVLDGKCYPFGYRKSGKFCSDDGTFKEELEGDEACENNFECESNVCVSGKCVSSGLMQRIIEWFKRLFGEE